MDEYIKMFTDERYNCLTQRIETLEKRQKDIEELISAVAVLAQRMGTVEKNVSEMSVNVRSLMERPGKRWDSVVEKVILVVVGAVVAWVLTQIGIK
ncbi:MAG: hypothetical protein ACI4QW_03540 [Clostridia bacterium]